MSSPLPYMTIKELIEFQGEPVKGSRFVGQAAPARSPEDAAALLDQARQRWPDASHHCWAFQLVDGRCRSSDAGEPGGSAGRPILAMINGHDLQDVVVVVTRWFGGTKLGVGGLIRAYGGCAGRTLDRADVVTRLPMTTLSVQHSYPDTGAIQAVLGSRGVQPLRSDWGTEVTLTLCVPADQAPQLMDALRDATSGRVQLEVKEGQREEGQREEGQREEGQREDGMTT